jgi:exodeoxyribonuclease V beta subunit
VITVHKSKGLEFPVVFFPYAWSALAPDSRRWASCHDPQDRTVLIKDLGSDEFAEHQASEREEALAEQCRLFYVALTRAKYRCYLAWGAVNDAGLSAPAYLFHCAGLPGGPGLAERVRVRFGGLSDEHILRDLERLASGSGGTIEVLPIPGASVKRYQPAAGQIPALRARQFAGDIVRDWGSASFSSWNSGSARAAELPDHDAVPDGPENSVAEGRTPAGLRSIRDFPKGARAGSCLHSILESVDFADTAARSPESVAQKLEQFGFDPVWAVPVCRMLEDVLSTPLEAGGERIVLGQLAPHSKLTEVEFCFPLDRVTPRALAEAFVAHPAAPVSPGFADRVRRLEFAPLQGIMKGFIDLVFEFRGRYYLIDWKSNFLGPKVDDYGLPALRRAMENGCYTLQYHLYCVALHRYLAARVRGYTYERHWGGVFYLFLRGLDPARGGRCGIYYDRPPEGRIAALSALLSP